MLRGYFSCFLCNWKISWSNLTFLVLFADKSHVAPRISLVNVPALNYLLRSEIYVAHDGQLRAAHLVLGYQPLSSAFQAVGHAIRAGSLRLVRIDVSQDGFLADHDLPPVVLPGVRNPYLAE